MPVCFANHLTVKMLISRQCPIISLNQPQNQVEPGKLFAVQRSILGIANNFPGST
jgi:hypothetical protein